MFSLLLVLIYLCFISLGLPDSLLGAAWPVLHRDIGVPLSYAGIISIVIFAGTITSSLLCDRISARLGAGLLTAVSITLTSVGLWGFSAGKSFPVLILWSIPYGLGAGGVDAMLNSYVALHYKARHMSWLHCFWGIGASVSPYIMSFSLVRLSDWSKGYLIVAIIQIVLSALVFISLPLWKKEAGKETTDEPLPKPLSLREVISIPGAIPCFFTFFGYCSLELTTSLWASSYLVQSRGIDAVTASAFASMFYIGITLGRAINGFLTFKFNDHTLIRLGFSVIALGIILIFVPFHNIFPLAGFVIAGLGCAPIYPCIIHMTPEVFGRDRSQAMIGMQMAFAYTGFCIAPPLFGLVAEHITISVLPVYQLMLLIFMVSMYKLMLKNKEKHLWQ